jgi:cadmium resistance protein CadD (predicted permease)
MVWVWCIIARYLAYHPILANYLARYGHVIMPIVLFALGIFILHESKTASLLF